MSGSTRRNTGRFSSAARNSNGPALNEAFSCNILRELDKNIKSSYNKAWTDLDGLKKNGAELLKQLKYEDRDITVFAKKLLDYANSSNKEFNTQNASILDCVRYAYYNGSKFVKDTADDVMSNSYIKLSGAVKALNNLAVGLGNVTNTEWNHTKSSNKTVPKNNYMSFDRKRSTRYIMDRIAGAGFAPDTVKDSDFYIMKKVPKAMSVASKACNDVLFWTFSKDPDFLGFKETDKLVAVTNGNEVIWSHQLADTPKYYKNVKDVFNTMTSEFNPYRSDHGYSIKVIALRFSPDSTAKSGNEMWEKRRGRGDARRGMIRQENEYVRMMDYIKILNDNITRYKRIIASNRLKSDTVESDMKNIISKVSAAMPKLFEQNVDWVRSVSNSLSVMMSNFESYRRYRDNLNDNETNNPWMSRSWVEVSKENIKNSKDKILKCIDEINGYLNKLS